MASARLIWQRRNVEKRMTDLCTIYSEPAHALANRGEEPEVAAYPGAWTAQSTAVKCRVSSKMLSGRESAASGQVQSSMYYNIFVPATTTRPADGSRVRVTTMSNRDFEIVGSMIVSDNLALKLEVVEVR